MVILLPEMPTEPSEPPVGSLARSRVGLNQVASETAMTVAATTTGTAARRKRTWRLCRAAARNARSRPGRLNPAQPSLTAPSTSLAKAERFIPEPSFLEPSLRVQHGPCPSGTMPYPRIVVPPSCILQAGAPKIPCEYGRGRAAPPGFFPPGAGNGQKL